MRRARKIESVEKEFDEPFNDVIRGFAIMGYSVRALADILKFNRSYLSEVIKKRGLGRYFKRQRDMVKECRPGGKGWAKGVKRPYNPRYSDDYLLGLVSLWPNYSDFRTFAPVDYSTVTRRFRMQWRKIVALARERWSGGFLVDRESGRVPGGPFCGDSHEQQAERFPVH